ncbi:MAG: tetratricopeptide repeat protein [Gammaproteobacteria bacterium]|nr:tetratricopeptide repeat protein [Gammaproteobacteria bacterium]
MSNAACRQGFAALLAFALLMQTATGMPIADPRLASLRDNIEHSYNAGNTQAIDSIRIAIMNIGDTAGEDDATRDLAIYLAAYARLRQSLLVADNKALARGFLEDCITGLKPLLERRADNAQARALLGSCYGASSRYHFLSAAWRGLEAGRQIAIAVEQAPDNAWVVFQDGVSDYETPAMVGGNKKRAVIKLRRAAELFAASRPPGSSLPVWGEAETWLYIGRTHRDLGETEAAREALQTALSMAPDSRDIRAALAGLP